MRKFVGHAIRLLQKFHQQYKTYTQTPQSDEARGYFLAPMRQERVEFPQKNETLREKKAREISLKKHRAAKTRFQQGAKAHKSESQREGAVRGEAKIRAMTKANLQKRRKNPDTP